MRIIIRQHALDRHLERAGPITREELADEIRHKLQSQLRGSMKVDRGGAVTVHLGQGYRAVAHPARFGGWEVVTIYRR